LWSIIDQPKGHPSAHHSVAIEPKIETHKSAISRHRQGKKADAIAVMPLE
jgi:hypothetical protein